MFRPTVAQISFQNLKNNWDIINSISKKTNFVLPVVKANSYGHGDLQITQSLAKLGAQRMAVGLIEEGIRLRESGINCEIFLLGPFRPQCLKEIREFKITPIINGWNEIEAIQKIPDLKCHLKFDTGMNRLGFRWNEVDKVKEKTTELNVQGLCTHLAAGTDLEISKIQISKFKNVIQHFDKKCHSEIHLFNTDGLFSHTHKNEPIEFGIRPGLALYGYSTVNSELTKKLKPVMKLISKVAHVKWIEKGESVSYDGTWSAQRRSCIAVIPLGYADGYHRSLSNKGRVSVHGCLLPIVGRICMDYFMVDATEIANRIAVDDEVEIFGENVSLVELASSAGTIVWELLTSISERVPKVLGT